MNTKLYNELSKVQLDLHFRIVAGSEYDSEIQRLANWFANYGAVQVDNRKLPIGDRIQQAFADQIDLILILDGLESYFGVYSIIHSGKRYSLKLEDIMRLVAGG